MRKTPMLLLEAVRVFSRMHLAQRPQVFTRNGSLLWSLCFCLLLCNTSFGQWNQQDKIVASNRSAGAAFGHYHASGIWEDHAVVGAPLGNNNNGQQAGAAYVYERDPVTCEWSEVQMLTASDGVAFDAFGQAVAINDRFIAVGAPYESEDANGQNTLSDAGSVYLFEYDMISASWVQVAKLVAADREVQARFGVDVDLYQNRVVIGADRETYDTFNPASPLSGAAYVFRENTPGVWIEEQKLLAADRDDNDRFGHAVAIHGDMLVVGSADEHDVNGQNPMGGAGAAFIFERVGLNWSQVQKITPTAPDRQGSEYFSRSVDIEGNVILVGAAYDILDENLQNGMNTAGSAFIFREDAQGTWLIEDKIDASDRDYGDQFGASVAIYGNRIAIGAEQDDQAGPIYNSGAVYFFEFDGVGTWNEVDKDLANDFELADRMGVSIAMYGGQVLVGAFMEDEDAAPIPGNPISNAGSAYIYHTDDPADQPIVAIPAPFCSGQPVDLMIIAGNLNGNSNWVWYANSCGGTLVGTGSTITVTPTGNTTYYVQGTGGGCTSNGPCGSVTVNTSSTTSWHQTSKNTAGTEVNNDVATDLLGNVYVTGSFFGETTLDGGTNADIVLNSFVPGTESSFTACYNSCGDLMWAAEVRYSKGNSGNSLVMDELNQLVYVTGTLSSDITYFNSNLCGNGFANLYSAGLTKGYVAAFEASTGCLQFLEMIDLAPYTSCEALAIDESNGDLFVGGHAGPNNSGANSSAFLRHYSPTATALGPVQAGVNSTSPGQSQVNDMDYDENNQLLWAIGTYQEQVAFTPGNTLIAQNGNVTEDAFVLAYENSGGLNPVIVNRGNTSNSMTGNGIAVDPQDGSAYLTGQYLNAISAPFQFNTVGSLFNGSVPRAFMVKYDLFTNSGWSRFGRVPGGPAIGRAVAVGANQQVFFVGGYAEGILVLQTPGFLNLLVPYVSNPTNGSNEHLYIASYTPDGAAMWANATTDPNATSGEHEGMSIALSGQEAYIAGRYFDNMDYLVTMGPAAPLNSTGVGHNAFILRTDLQSSSFLRPSEDGDEGGEESDGGTRRRAANEATAEAGLDHFQLTGWPNPANDVLHVRIENQALEEAGQILLFDLLGQQVRSVPMVQQTTSLSIKDLPAGVYVLQYQGQTQSQSIRIVKD